jgi:phage terminase small subunit
MTFIPDRYTPADEADPTALLSPKQKRFIEEYLVDFNATQAAIRAGYSAHNASEIAYENLRKPQICAALVCRARTLLTESDITPAQVLEELRLIAFSDISEMASWDRHGVTFRDSAELPAHVRRAIAEIQAQVTETRDGAGGTTRKAHLKLKTCDKLRALEALGRYLGFQA